MPPINMPKLCPRLLLGMRIAGVHVFIIIIIIIIMINVLKTIR